MCVYVYVNKLKVCACFVSFFVWILSEWFVASNTFSSHICFCLSAAERQREMFIVDRHCTRQNTRTILTIEYLDYVIARNSTIHRNLHTRMAWDGGFKKNKITKSRDVNRKQIADSCIYQATSCHFNPSL